MAAIRYQSDSSDLQNLHVHYTPTKKPRPLPMSNEFLNLRTVQQYTIYIRTRHLVNFPGL